MIHFIWVFLIVIGIVIAAVNGNVEVVTQAAMQAATQGVSLTLELAAILALWMGLLHLAERSGLIQALANRIRPLLHFLFPGLPKKSSAFGPMGMNIAANLLGLGNAATPCGLKTMAELQKINAKKDTASSAMITFLVLNTSSLTLLPATIIALRISTGSLNAGEIIMPAFLASLFGLTVGLLADAFLRKRRQA